MQDRVDELERKLTELMDRFEQFTHAILEQNKAFEQYVEANEARIDAMKSRGRS